jgi:undecaprenyl diphosphate synthase
MDGNGRWAQIRGLPREAGHSAGIESFKKFVEYIRNTKIDYFTFYAFSTENWNRPKYEVIALMKIFKNQLEKVIKSVIENIRIIFIGEKSRLPKEICNLAKKIEDISRKNKGVTLNIAINYGGRAEILRAVSNLAEEISKENIKKEEISEEVFKKFLYTENQPDLDLIIRTGGEFRLSNFLLWQSAYAEFVSTKTLWPDFSQEDFNIALMKFANRKRKFGKV